MSRDEPFIVRLAPFRDLVTKRTPWVKNKLQEQSDRPIPAAREYVSGETVTYLGKNYRLKVLIGVAELLTRDSDTVSLSTHLPELNK